MGVFFRILRQHGVVYVRYEGIAGAAESMRAFIAYMQHPDCRPGQKHLVDLSAITGFDQDFSQIMELQALKIEQFIGQSSQTMLAYYAPGLEARKMAGFVLRSWEAHDEVIARVLETEAEALAFLGISETRIEDLLGDRV